MPNFRYIHIRNGYQKGSTFDGYKAFGYWTVEQIIDPVGTDVYTQGLFLDPNVPKEVTIVIKRNSFDEPISPQIVGLPEGITYTVDPTSVTDTEFKATLTSTLTEPGIFTASVTGIPLPARTRNFTIYCSFGWAVGNLQEIGWLVGTMTTLN